MKRECNGYEYHKVKVSNLPGHFWRVWLCGAEHSYRTQEALRTFLRTQPHNPIRIDLPVFPEELV